VASHLVAVSEHRHTLIEDVQGRVMVALQHGVMLPAATPNTRGGSCRFFPQQRRMPVLRTAKNAAYAGFGGRR